MTDKEFPVRVDLNDPDSVAAYYRANPQRHGPQIAWFARVWPQFAAAIKRAGQMLKTEKKQ